ncbi:MAG: FtsX-like permease family protein [Kordiimonadaceae bacterium]|nr:FtsX-like permease family protein [Kordiimonadaceae bacterium]
MKNFALKLTWANITARPLPTILTIATLAAAVSLISIMLQFANHADERLKRDLAGVDLVVSGKGSPLQSILSSLLHVDVPTGNIPLSEAQRIMKEPMIRTAIPLGLGDSFRGFRIVGTNHDYIDLYQAKIDQGVLWKYPLQVVIGSEVSKQLNMQIGQKFAGAHGLSLSDEDLHTHDHAAYEVVGILERQSSIVDRLILTSIDSVWLAHDENALHGGEESHDHDHDHAAEESHDHDHDHAAEESHDHDHDHAAEESHDHDHDHATEESHDHDHDHDHDHAMDLSETPLSDLKNMNPGDKEVTALLIKYTSPIAAVRMPKEINNQPGLQAASPAMEITRLYNISSGLTDAGKLLAIVMTFIGGLSIFVAFSNAAVHKIYDIALLRAMGAKPNDVFMLQIYEGTIVSMFSGIVGIAFAHLIIIIAASTYAPLAVFGLDGNVFYLQEIYLLLCTVLIGILAATWPALSSYRIDPMLLLKGKR